jgi:hypothetical protein
MDEAMSSSDSPSNLSWLINNDNKTESTFSNAEPEPVEESEDDIFKEMSFDSDDLANAKGGSKGDLF